MNHECSTFSRIHLKIYVGLQVRSEALKVSCKVCLQTFSQSKLVYRFSIPLLFHSSLIYPKSMKHGRVLGLLNFCSLNTKIISSFKESSNSRLFSLRMQIMQYELESQIGDMFNHVVGRSLTHVLAVSYYQRVGFVVLLLSTQTYCPYIMEPGNKVLNL